MDSYANKTQQNEHQSIADSLSRSQSSHKTYQKKENAPKEGSQGNYQAMADMYTSKQQVPVQKKANNTGLPDQLKSGVENLSGHSMNDVKVHYNSAKPATLQAHAYAQGSDIHLGPGQEKHLPHETWHVVQQKQGRVKPTMQMRNKVAVNDDSGLEKEADVMGNKALQAKSASSTNAPSLQMKASSSVVQRLTGYEVETNIPVFSKYNEAASGLTDLGQNGFTENIGAFLTGGLKYGMNYGEDKDGRFSISADHNELMYIHRRLIDKLIVLGLLKEGFKHRSLANIEYITPPREEIGTGSKAEHQKDITAVKTHLNQTLGEGSKRKVVEVPAPGQEIFTGYPFSELLAWVDANGIEKTAIGAELLEMNKAINNAIYVQETSGVLPEDIPAVYAEASKAIMETENPTKIPKLMAGLMTIASQAGAAAFGEEPVPELFTTHKKAIVGYLTLVSSYLLADNVSFLKDLSQTGSTDKNLVPFMSKAKLHTIKDALPVAVRPSAALDSPWRAFQTNLKNEAEKFPTTYWSETYEMEVNEEKALGSVFPGGITEALAKLCTGVGDVIGVITGNVLGLDTPHSDVEAATGQKAIPLEDRYFGKKYDDKLTSDNMEEALGTRFAFATGLNLAHIPEAEGKRATALEQTNTERSAGQKEGDLVKRTKDRIDKIAALHKLLYQANILGEETDPNVLKWRSEIQEALLKESPEKDEQLKTITDEVYTTFTGLHKLKNKAVNEDKGADHNTSFDGSVERVAKELDMEFGRKVLDFNKKELKATDLKEEDQAEMTRLLKEVEKTIPLYQLAKKRLVDMDSATDASERIKAMNIIRKVIAKLIERIKAAEEFHQSKKVVEII